MAKQFGGFWHNYARPDTNNTLSLIFTRTCSDRSAAGHTALRTMRRSYWPQLLPGLPRGSVKPTTLACGSDLSPAPSRGRINRLPIQGVCSITPPIAPASTGYTCRGTRPPRADKDGLQLLDDKGKHPRHGGTRPEIMRVKRDGPRQNAPLFLELMNTSKTTVAPDHHIIFMVIYQRVLAGRAILNLVVDPSSLFGAVSGCGHIDASPPLFRRALRWAISPAAVSALSEDDRTDPVTSLGR